MKMKLHFAVDENNYVRNQINAKITPEFAFFI